jgi:integrase
MGLRLGEGIRLTVGDIDADNMRVHIRDAKATRIAWCHCPTRPCA